MIPQNTLSQEGQELKERLNLAWQQSETWRLQEEQATTVHVAGVGQTLSTAYEQLRNAAEYTEEHLLLQRTIRRFYRRNISFYDKRAIKNIGEELIIELTQSGYLPNDSVPKSYIDEIEALVASYYDIYWQLRSHHVGIERGSEWTLDILSVATEAVFHKGEAVYMSAFADFAYNHYFESLKKAVDVKDSDYEMALFIAVHRALLKSDKAVIRSSLLQRQNGSFEDLKSYVRFNQKIDTVFESRQTEALVRLINKNGAPLRILKRLIDDYPEIGNSFGDRVAFLSAYEAQTEKEYKEVSQRVNRGIIKSIAFLFITKVIVGLAIEVPYDLYVVGSIIWLPLAINLLFPPIYMAALKLSMKLPGNANTVALREYVDRLFYDTKQESYYVHARPNSNESSVLLNIMYGTMFVFVFSLVTLRLWLWDFAPVHIFIFFLFLSTASFLGFRLSRMISELEVVTTNQGVISMLRDFLYTPFILVGRWISDKYARINIVALILDMAIELPLKTFLRLTRQWTQFLNDKKDQL